MKKTIEELREELAILEGLAEDAAQSTTISREEWSRRVKAVSAKFTELQAHPEFDAPTGTVAV